MAPLEGRLLLIWQPRPARAEGFGSLAPLTHFSGSRQGCPTNTERGRPCLTACAPVTRSCIRLGSGVHSARASGQRRYPSKSTRAAGRYDYQWVKARAEAIRLQPRCSFCSSSDLTGDHIQSLAEGGMNLLEKIRVLCRSCNTRRENTRRKGRHC
ncbi:HNH endonuclease [Streptomyces sp. NPDC059874]|uniref:HNH endonuclease n=1 Tax=Streptomyces sp. NPDC059874 TaxID=3346983 RepID=UPI00364A8A0E